MTKAALVSALTLLVVLSFIGVLMVIARRRKLSADLAMIESWGATSFSELDEELDDELDEELLDDMEDFPRAMEDAALIDESESEQSDESTDSD